MRIKSPPNRPTHAQKIIDATSVPIHIYRYVIIYTYYSMYTPPRCSSENSPPCMFIDTSSYNILFYIDATSVPIEISAASFISFSTSSGITSKKAREGVRRIVRRFEKARNLLRRHLREVGALALDARPHLLDRLGVHQVVRHDLAQLGEVPAVPAKRDKPAAAKRT